MSFMVPCAREECGHIIALHDPDVDEGMCMLAGCRCRGYVWPEAMELPKTCGRDTEDLPPL